MKAKKINLLLFGLFLVFLVALPPLFKDRCLSNAERPWQLMPFGADSLSDFYKEHYPRLESKPLLSYLSDTTKKTVMVLVDGWGVPYDKVMLVSDFLQLSGSKTRFCLHDRFKNITSLAESDEYGTAFANGILLYGGDSLSCSKRKFGTEKRFLQTICFKNYSDTSIVGMVDSLLSDSTWHKIAWTTRQTREGDREILHQVLQGLSMVAKKHSDVQFIIQGTHRPTQGTPETRRKYLAPWVPAAFINCELRPSI
jgi:hypothetical protein